MQNKTKEIAFESVIEADLLARGYVSLKSKDFDKDLAIFPSVILDFIRNSQPKEWQKLENLLGSNINKQILNDLCKWMDTYGSLATLRHGFKCYGRTIKVAFFKPAYGLNAEIKKQYDANQIGITRQLHYSQKNSNSIDITLSVNGIPIITLELKNPMSGQTIEDAITQYRKDRDPREPIFEFKRRTLVHFAVDTENVSMTTRLAASATRFLPFNRGLNGGAGNPIDLQGRNYRTAYLWEVVLERDSLMDLLARFLHLEVKEVRNDEGQKSKREEMIFPRYHQLEAIRKLVKTAKQQGVGHNYLIEHSAGSGKSNTIGWLAHRLSSLHNDKDKKIFDSVIVVTDRTVLDQQLQNTIYQFEHRQGVVQKIDEDSRQLAEALDSAVPIIITTLQKFPFVTKHLQKMAKERGETGSGTLPTRRCAVIIDEAHSSQSGEATTKLKGVLGGEELVKKAQQQAKDEGEEDIEKLFRQMAERSQQANLSMFAFTATPKYKTMEIFNETFHLYTMRQAVEEGFIMDVLKNYTTYKTYYKLLRKSEKDLKVERRKAAKSLARFVRLHPYNLIQKAEVMLDHFYFVTRHKMGGRAKAMVVASSRLEAVRYKQNFDRYSIIKDYPIKTLVAFSGVVEDDVVPGKTYTEEAMNNKIKEKELPEAFATPLYQVLLVAEKYQTGFDQPLLHTMYIDKKLSGLQAVQTLSRLNRTH
ncbi:MAG: type I restriction endonuclease, partial [Blastocatellia bacterium]